MKTRLITYHIIHAVKIGRNINECTPKLSTACQLCMYRTIHPIVVSILRCTTVINAVFLYPLTRVTASVYCNVITSAAFTNRQTRHVPRAQNFEGRKILKEEKY